MLATFSNPANITSGFSSMRISATDIQASGRLVSSERLQAVSTASTVRVRDGKISTTDGPYAETKEQLGGYYLVEAKDLNDAIQTASRIPSARNGAIEVRPVWSM